jgi:hypothetical protein
MTANRYSIGAGTLASLLAGRSGYRLIQLAATVVLLPIWGAAGYATFATAIASFSWVTALVLTGPEKVALKIVPRAPRTGALVTGALLAGAWVLPLPLVLAFATALATAPREGAVVYLGVAAMQLGAGCTLLLVGLHRVAGRPRSDAATFAALSVVQVLATAAAALGLLRPAGYVAFVVAAQLVVNAVLALALGRPSLAIRRRPRFLRRIAWTAVLMGGADVCLYLSSGVLFALLAASASAGQVGRLFVVDVVWSAGVNMLIYVLRVYAPQTSLRQAGRATDASRRRAGRVAGIVAVANVAWLGAAGLVLAATGLAEVSSPAAQTLLWAVLFATRAPALAGLLWAGYLLENADATATRVTGLAAVAGLAAATVAGLVAVPALGGTGLILSLAVAETVQASVLALRADRARRGRSGARAQHRRTVAGTSPEADGVAAGRDDVQQRRAPGVRQ